MNNMIYSFAAKVENVEYIMVEPSKSGLPYLFESYETAKGKFRVFYENVRRPGAAEYNQILNDLKDLNPVIIGLDPLNAFQQIMQWQKSPYVKRIDGNCLQDKIFLVEMKQGFILKYGVLDILQDLETDFKQKAATKEPITLYQAFTSGNLKEIEKRFADLSPTEVMVLLKAHRSPGQA